MFGKSVSEGKHESHGYAHLLVKVEIDVGVGISRLGKRISFFFLFSWMMHTVYDYAGALSPLRPGSRKLY